MTSAVAGPEGTGAAVADERLKNYVLARADEDADLSDEARLVVLAALESPEDLSDVLGGGTAKPELVESLTAPADVVAEPASAYLTSISVEGFRGIGPQATLPFKPDDDDRFAAAASASAGLPTVAG